MKNQLSLFLRLTYIHQHAVLYHPVFDFKRWIYTFWLRENVCVLKCLSRVALTGHGHRLGLYKLWGIRSLCETINTIHFKVFIKLDSISREAETSACIMPHWKFSFVIYEVKYVAKCLKIEEKCWLIQQIDLSIGIGNHNVI